MKTHKVVLIGGPGTGKTTIINTLMERGCCCLEEVSRQITKEAQKQGVTQLFLKDPFLFSQKLLDGRIQQYKNSENIKQKLCFFDRGIPDVGAYIEYNDDEIPNHYIKANKKHRYDQVFYFPIWKEIYLSDNERYESLEEAIEIEQYIVKTYKDLGYDLIEVPKDTVEVRVDFILNKIKNVDAK